MCEFAVVKMQHSSFVKYVHFIVPKCRKRSPFAGYSHFAQKSKVMKSHKIVILGEDGFFDLGVNDETNCIVQPFTETYRIFSYLVQNNKYLIIFGDTGNYNVYDMFKRQWLLQRNTAVLGKTRSTSSRGVMIDEEMLIIYDWKLKKLKFYRIGENYLVNPLLIHEYELKIQKKKFNGCAMCVTNLVKQQSTYKFDITLFGGRLQSCLPLFYSFNISISHLKKMTDNFNDNNIVIKEHLLDENEIQCINIDKTRKLRWINLSVECVTNFTNEQIILIVGADQKKDIHLFNCHTKTFIRKQNVKY